MQVVSAGYEYILVLIPTFIKMFGLQVRPGILLNKHIHIAVPHARVPLGWQTILPALRYLQQMHLGYIVCLCLSFRGAGTCVKAGFSYSKPLCVPLAMLSKMANCKNIQYIKIHDREILSGIEPKRVGVLLESRFSSLLVFVLVALSRSVTVSATLLRLRPAR